MYLYCEYCGCIYIVSNVDVFILSTVDVFILSVMSMYLYCEYCGCMSKIFL